MPVAKQLSYATPRPRTGRSRRIGGPSFVHLFCINQDEAFRTRPEQASSQEPAGTTASPSSRPLFRTVTQFVGAAGEILLIIASWLVKELFDGCATYAMAMHGFPVDADSDEAGDAKSSTSSEPPADRSSPALRVISADQERDIPTAKTLRPPDTAHPCLDAEDAPRSGQTPNRHLD